MFPAVNHQLSEGVNNEGDRYSIMMTRLTMKLLCLVMALAACLGYLPGCKTPEEYKTEADEDVYNIIDSKWDESYGTKTNYKISDTEPSPDALRIDKEIPSSGILTLPHAVAIATAHNRQYQFEREALYIKALELTRIRHTFDPNFFGVGTAGYSKNAFAVGEQMGTDPREPGLSLTPSSPTLGMNWLLATGARVTTRLTLSWVEIITGNYRSGLSSLISAAIRQPLLRGADSRVIFENLTQAERDTVYQIRAFNRFRQTFVVEVVTQYYDILEKADYFKNARSNLETLIGLHEHAEKLTNAGFLPKFELNQAHQDRLQAEEIYVQAEKEYKQALDEFKLTLSLPANSEFRLDHTELEVLADADLTIPEFSEDEVIETALMQRLDLANTADAVDDAERKVLVAIDNFKSSVDFVAGTELPVQALTNRSQTYVPGQFNLDPHTEDILITGLGVDLALNRFIERNEYRMTLIAVDQQRRYHEEAVDIVSLEVRQAYRDLTEAAERHRIQIEALQLGRKRFTNSLKLLQYRRTNTRDVLDAQEDLFEAQNAATEALIDYTLAMLNFYRDTGVLQIRPDGMWQY